MTQQEKRLKLISDLYKDVLSPYRNFSTDLGIAVVEDGARTVIIDRGYREDGFDCRITTTSVPGYFSFNDPAADAIRVDYEDQNLTWEAFANKVNDDSIFTDAIINFFGECLLRLYGPDKSKVSAGDMLVMNFKNSMSLVVGENDRYFWVIREIQRRSIERDKLNPITLTQLVFDAYGIMIDVTGKYYVMGPGTCKSIHESLGVSIASGDADKLFKHCIPVLNNTAFIKTVEDDTQITSGVYSATGELLTSTVTTKLDTNNKKISRMKALRDLMAIVHLWSEDVGKLSQARKIF